jgi:hypothetical protein
MVVFQIRGLQHDFTELVFVDIFHVPVLKKIFQFFINYLVFEDNY